MFWNPWIENCKGSFKNHMDRFLLFFDHPPTLMDIFDILNGGKNGKFQTTYPPSVVHVVFEWPLMQPLNFYVHVCRYKLKVKIIFKNNNLNNYYRLHICVYFYLSMPQWVKL